MCMHMLVLFLIMNSLYLFLVISVFEEYCKNMTVQYVGLVSSFSLSKCVSHFSVNIKMDLHEVGCGGVDWIEVACGHVAGTCECSNEPSGSVQCGEFLD
jgi:hypothetical protein